MPRAYTNSGECLEIENVAYAAGLVDGEGSVCLTKDRRENKFRYPCVSIPSTSFELIEFLQETFGGSVHQRRVRKPTQNPTWVWQIRGTKALDFLSMVLPYMKEFSKISRAAMLVDGYRRLTNRGGKYTKEAEEAKFRFEEYFLSIGRRPKGFRSQ